MDSSRFDEMVRAFGAGVSRRGALGLLAAVAAGGAATDAGARRRCRKDSPTGQCCKKRDGVVTCTCKDGGTVCGVNCCRIGQECEDGQCLEMPEPTTCIAYGEPCKGAGRRCCENLVCGSGQGGQADVACYVRKTGRCTSTSECTFGTECVDGICVGLPPAPVCTTEFGGVCTASSVCCAGTCGNVGKSENNSVQLSVRCCVAEGEACSDSNQCCCFNSQKPISVCNTNTKVCECSSP